MRGILIERGTWFKLEKAVLTDTRLEIKLFKLDLLTVGIRLAKISTVDRGLESKIRELCRRWAEEARGLNLAPLSDHMAGQILNLIYAARKAEK